MASKLVAVLFGAALLIAADSVAIARGPGDVRGATTDINVEGTWTLDFCWEGAECGQTTMSIRQVTVFIAVDLSTTPAAADAVGIVVGRRLFAQFLSSCRPLYRSSNVTERSMSGTMECTEGYPIPGTWSAVKEAAAPDGSFSPSGGLSGER